MNKSKILLISLAFVLLLNLFGCSNEQNNNQKEDSSTSKNMGTEQIIDDNMVQDSNYYSFLEEVAGRPSINISINEYLDNYNSIKSKYENYNYKDLDTSDFTYVEKGNNNGVNINVYSCPLTIMGRSDWISIIIALNEDDNKTVNQVMLRVENFEMFENKYHILLMQYQLLIESLGISNEEATQIVSDLLDNGQSTNHYDVYKKGLAFFIDNAQMVFFRILPMTENEYNNA